VPQMPQASNCRRFQRATGQLENTGRVDEVRARVDQLTAEVTRLAQAGGDLGATGRRLDGLDAGQRAAAGAAAEAKGAVDQLRTDLAALERRIGEGHPVLLEIEVQGARQIRQTMPEAMQIFIAPPSADVLRSRLIGRGTDPPEDIEARLRTARRELAAQDEFREVVVNDRLEEGVEKLEAIVRGALHSEP